VTQLLDRERVELRAQLTHQLGEALECRGGLVELVAGPIVSSRAAAAAAIAE
jgi:hypothetical protein